MGKANKTKADIEEELKKENVSAELITMSLNEKIDYLINSAGIMALQKYTASADGFERQFAVNYLAHYYLTMLLLPVLVKSKSRIISLSSRGHMAAPEGNAWIEEMIKAKSGPSEKEYGTFGFLEYGYTKTSNLLFAQTLNRRYGSLGITSVSLHSGDIQTQLWQHMDLEKLPELAKTHPKIAAVVTDKEWIVQKTTEQGAALSNDEIEGGAFYVDCNVCSTNRLRDDVKPHNSVSAGGKLFESSELLLAQQPEPQTLSTDEVTDYGKDGVEVFEQLQREMNWFYDGCKTNIMHQLSKYLKDKDTSKMCLIDVPCANGNYSRWIAEHYNFKQILAVDISADEIKKAIKETDAEKYPNIKYQTVDASTFHTNKDFAHLKERFDCAILPWIFCHAQSKQMLNKFMRSVRFVLKPNAFVVGVTTTINDVKNLRVGYLQNDTSFSLKVDPNMKCEEGLWIHNFGSAKFRFVEYLYTHQTYHKLFAKNGFESTAFLKSNEWIDGRNSTDSEKKLMAKFVNGKDTFTHILTARTKNKQINAQ